jgi:hypothetical protein
MRLTGFPISNPIRYAGRVSNNSGEVAMNRRRSSLVIQGATGDIRRRQKKSIAKANPNPHSLFSNRSLIEF